MVVKQGRKFTRPVIRKMAEAGIDRLPVDRAQLLDKYAARDIFDESTGEMLADCNAPVVFQIKDKGPNYERLDKIVEAGITSFPVLYIDDFNVGSFLRDTLEKDGLSTKEEAVMEIYRRLRPAIHRPRTPPRTSLTRLLPRGPLRPLAGRSTQAQPQVRPR